MTLFVINFIIGIITLFIHKNKGYSPIAGFLWGACFSVLGLIVVLLEKDKAEMDAKYAGKKKPLSVGAWIIIFTVPVTILIFILLFCV